MILKLYVTLEHLMLTCQLPLQSPVLEIRTHVIIYPTCRLFHTCQSAGCCRFPAAFAAPWSDLHSGCPQLGDACSPGRHWRGFCTSAHLLRGGSLKGTRGGISHFCLRTLFSEILNKNIWLTAVLKPLTAGQRSSLWAVCAALIWSSHQSVQNSKYRQDLITMSHDLLRASYN